MNCSRIIGKYRLQYDFDDLLSGNAEQYRVLLSMWLRVRRPVSMFPSAGVLSTRLDDRAGLSFFESIFVLGIGFIAVQENPEPILPSLTSNLGRCTTRETRGCIIYITRAWHFDKNARLITR